MNLSHLATGWLAHETLCDNNGWKRTLEYKCDIFCSVIPQLTEQAKDLVALYTGSAMSHKL